MNYCPNCGNTIGCSCSGGSTLATASDGKKVCSKCLSTYESYKALLNINKQNLSESKKSK